MNGAPIRIVSAICAVLLLTGCSPEASDSPSTARPATPLFLHPEGEALPPGRYAVPFVGLDQDAAEAEVDVPRGFEPYNGSFLWHGSDNDPPYALSFWRISGVNPEPCQASPPTYENPGPSARDLATALRRQQHRQGSPAVPVQLSGYEGLYLELTFPKAFRPENCATGSYEAWEAVAPETGQEYPRYQYGPGFVDRLWILDVAGERLVVNATFDRRISEEDLSTLEAMVDSVGISAQTAS